MNASSTQAPDVRAASDLHVQETRKLAWHVGTCQFCRSREAGPGCAEGEAQVETVLSLGTAVQDARRRP